MSGEFDAAGTAIEGALLGAAVEKSAGGIAFDENGESDTICLNCSARLSGAFCATCGQKAHVHRTLSAIGHDVLHSVFHFDGKLWRTLPLLLFKPGELTRRYVHGERAKFVSPMGLFLFAIFMMFAVFSFTGDGGEAQLPKDIRSGMEQEAQTLDKQIAELEAKLKKAPPGSAEVTELTRQLNNAKAERNGIALVRGEKAEFGKEGAQVEITPGTKLSAMKSETGIAWFDKRLNEGGAKMIANPGLAFYKLQTNGYKFAWLLVPLSLPFVWLVTIGVRGHRFYDHAVFTTYSISFMCILFIVASMANWAGVADDWLLPAFTVIPILHIYKQLRHAYGLSRLGTLLRMIPLMLSIVFVASQFFLILLMLGMMG